MPRFSRLATLTLLLWATHSWAGDGSKRLACGTQTTPDATAICKLLQTHMEFEWSGHATLAPGYRVTFTSIRKVWCARPFSPTDVPALQQLEKSQDWRLQMGANALRILVEKAPQPANSVYNPENPAYILRQGCGV